MISLQYIPQERHAENPQLQRLFGDDLLEIAPPCCGSPCRIAGKPLLAGFQELLRPGVIQALGNPLAAQSRRISPPMGIQSSKAALCALGVSQVWPNIGSPRSIGPFMRPIRDLEVQIDPHPIASLGSYDLALTVTREGTDSSVVARRLSRRKGSSALRRNI